MMYNNDPVIARKLQKIGEEFCIPGPFFAYEEIKMGNVNQTYKVSYIRDDGSGMAQIKSYLLQRINTYAFEKPAELMENIDRVTEHIRREYPNQISLHFHHTKDGKNYLEDRDGFWRMSNYVPSVTFDSCDDPKVIRSTGEAFGDFQMMLAGFDPEKLHYTIADFHNTRWRYQQLRNSIAKNPCGRVAEVEAEIEWLLSVEEEACRLTDMQERGELPLRVTHNDTKINNVLFDQVTHKPLVVIDLDTVMPGLAAYDFGDSIRSGASTAAEDERDLSKVTLSLTMFEAFVKGFLSEAKAALNDTEKDLLPMSAILMTLECGMRFLGDHLNGDVYFSLHYENQNLYRARTQMKLVADMEAQIEDMKAIVAKYR